MIEGGSNLLIFELYFKTKKIAIVDSRDFVEKGIGFWWENAFYYYTSYMNIDNVPLPENTTRGRTDFCLLKMERDENGKIKLTNVQSIDSKLSSPL